MKALSIRQPWANMILHAGKDIENREWLTRYRGPILIHAAKAMTRADVEAFRIFVNADDRLFDAVNRARERGAMELQRGGIVGRATIMDCVTWHDSPWFCGRYGFVLADPTPLPFHPCRGALGLFDVEMPG